MLVNKIVRNWLFVGIVLVFVQVIIGGITRLTDSGLSITEWEVIAGTIPPLNEADWQIAFDKYKVAANKQFESLHADMTLSEFKFIYFWEWFHRLWARMMGFIFLFPFLFFLFKSWIPRWLLKRLGVVILLAATVAVFGWIMVASGLNDDNRTWVSAYKLLSHLILATILFGYLFWTWLLAKYPGKRHNHRTKLIRLSKVICWLVFIQIGFGALMAGMRAGLIHPYFPFFIKFENLLGSLSLNSAGVIENVINYEEGIFMKGIVQILHRAMAYLLSALVFIQFIRVKNSNQHQLRVINIGMLVMLITQVLLGVLTIINCFGKVPLLYGVLHQAGALILFAFALTMNYKLRQDNDFS